MTKIKIGKYAKLKIGETTLRVFKVCGYSKKSHTMAEGFYIDQNGAFINPNSCDEYKGATSCFDF